MDRNNVLYKLRRKTQRIAFKLFSNETMSKLYYKIVLKKSLDLTNLITFNEKIQWLKLYYYPENNLVIQCADKYCVRDYVKSKGLGRYLTKIYGCWDSAKLINWEELPNKFVLKCNHGCAYNILCSDKNSFNINKSVKQLNKWMKEDFGSYNIEIHYSKIKQRKIICEEFLGDIIWDYKFYCFHGVPQFFYVSYDLIHDRKAKIGYFDIAGNNLPLKRDDYENIENITLPAYYDEMLNVAKELCQDFLFVRVDFFISNNKFYFGELTFTPGAGMMPIKPYEFDLKWGNMLNIETLINKKSNE